MSSISWKHSYVGRADGADKRHYDVILTNFNNNVCVNKSLNNFIFNRLISEIL